MLSRSLLAALAASVVAPVAVFSLPVASSEPHALGHPRSLAATGPTTIDGPLKFTPLPPPRVYIAGEKTTSDTKLQPIEY